MKKTVFFHSPNNPNYITNVKKIIQMSEDFIYTSEVVKARYDIEVDFHKLFIVNTILDNQTNKKVVKKTFLHKSGSLEEIYNKNTLNVLNNISERHDLLWIDDYFFEYNNTVIIVNKYFSNWTARSDAGIDIGESISQLKSFEGGRKIFLSTTKDQNSHIKLLNTLIGSLTDIEKSTEGFLVFLDFDKNKNKILFKKLIKGKTLYYETLLTKNTTTQPLLYNIDRDIIQAKYYENDFVVLLKGKDKNILRIYDTKDIHMNSYKTLDVEPHVTDFIINGNRVVYKTMDKTLSTLNIHTNENTKHVFNNVKDIENISIDRVLITTKLGNMFILNLNTLKNIQVKKVKKYD